ncbi:MAG: bifunctional riboflavin kinase/FAD synthetase [Bacteroidales bacterium]
MLTIFSPSAKLPGITAAIGFFDGVHLGHRALISAVISEAKRVGNASAIVTFRSHPRVVLHSDYRPQFINSFDEKIALLQETGLDYAIVLDFDERMSLMTGGEFIAFLKDGYNLKGLYIGYDHRFGHRRSECFEDYVVYGRNLGVAVYRADAVLIGSVPISSSAIRRFLLDGDLLHAELMLSYRYFLSGRVVTGYGVGRKIGFRTANIEVEDMDKLIPCNGVYAVCVTTVDGVGHKGMLNIGNRPTVHNSDERIIETHIFDFDADIYDTVIRVVFVAYLREERKMGSLKALQHQLALDRLAAMAVL